MTACAPSASDDVHLQLSADNIDSVLADMTLYEKTSLLVGAGWGSMFEGLHIPFTHGHRVPGAAGESRAIKRLGIPSIVFSDGPAGLRLKQKGATAFPAAIALASSGDTALVREVGRAIGEEAQAAGVDVMLMPGMNIIRNPLGGRNYEYFSEDVALSSSMASAIVRGVQSAGVGACVKHYALNNQETNRFRNDVQVDSLTMHNIYLENFRRTIEDTKPWCVMASYNSVNGTAVQENTYLLTDVLRGQWGYEGVVLTDWQRHTRPAEKIAAGVDLLMPGMERRINRIYRNVQQGKLSEERLDEAVRCMLQLIVKTHTFRGDGGQAYDTLAHAALARRAGAAGCVLLKNANNTLPLPQEVKNIALLGVHSYRLICGGTGSGFVNSAHRVSLDSGLTAAGYSLDPELRRVYEQYAGTRKAVRKVSGMGIVSKYMGQPSYNEMDIQEEMLRAAIDRADIAIVTVGRQSGEGKDNRLEKGYFYLSDTEQDLLRRTSAMAHEQGKRMVVVLNIANVMEVASWRDWADAILLVWCPGQEGGLAVADVLCGAVPPTGKLPVTFPMRYEDVPSSANFPLVTSGDKDVHYTRYAEGENIGHLYFDKHPEVPVAYAFGFGLTY